MKNAFYLLLLPFLSFSQNIQEKEYYDIYRACILAYTLDTNATFFINETSEYYSFGGNPDSFNKRHFSQFHEPPPIDSGFIDAIIKYQQMADESISLNFLTKLDTFEMLKIVSEKEKYNLVYRPDYKWFKLSSKRRKINTVYGFSKIAFSNNPEYAVVYMSSVSGMKSGSGVLFLCLKEEDEWTVKHIMRLWIS
jgi:hypothetical protein